MTQQVFHSAKGAHGSAHRRGYSAKRARHTHHDAYTYRNRMSYARVSHENTDTNIPFVPMLNPHGKSQGSYHTGPSGKRSRLDQKAQHHYGHNPVSVARKTFSDFRLAKLQIGNFISEEKREETDQRDARIRFYFRNATDKDPESEDAATAALAAPDRISLSIKKGTKRIIIPAEHLFSVEFSRSEGRIAIDTDGWAVFEELVSDESTHKQTVFRLTNVDPTEGELSRVKRIEAWLNLSTPLTEPKWTKGNLRDNIDSVSRFHNILHILDADPCPTLQSIIEQWTKDSTMGLQSERLLFQRSQLCKLNKLLEIFSNVLKPDSVLTAPTNGILNIIRTMGSSNEINQEELLEKVKQALFLIPEYLILKSLDTMFKKELSDPGPENSCNDIEIESTH